MELLLNSKLILHLHIYLCFYALLITTKTFNTQERGNDWIGFAFYLYKQAQFQSNQKQLKLSRKYCIDKIFAKYTMHKKFNWQNLVKKLGQNCETENSSGWWRLVIQPFCHVATVKKYFYNFFTALLGFTMTFMLN